MAFKKIGTTAAIPDTPDLLLRELPRRKIPDVLPHQQDVMRRYVTDALDHPDVALQLPTGSGKTLVGLLIAEWRRKKFKERVVYLCPTRQLVNQVVDQANNRYGLSVTGFTGQARSYLPEQKAAYQNIESIAVTTYNSLFNVNPYFKEADIVIIDDAHAAESYFSQMWSVHVSALFPGHAAVHRALCLVLGKYLDPLSFSRLQGEANIPADVAWIDKFPTPVFCKLHNEIAAILDTHAAALDLRYSWSLLRDHLHSCHLYLGNGELLLRPIVVPTWTHEPFKRPKQRLFMSATLGAGGDLERLTGRRLIKRIPIPDGWDRQGVGRRYFIFPERTLTEDEIPNLRHSLMACAGRSLVLVPSDNRKNILSEEIERSIGFISFDASMLETSKTKFVNEKNAVAIIANRYDGIDFPDDDCRLLFVESLPKAANLQEKFIMSRMGATVLYNERVQTRVLQSIGRCTRSLQDYSAVVITGEDLVDYIADPRRRKYFHPELQSEIEFGVSQSTNTTADDLLENFSIFIENGKEWEEVNRSIVDLRQKYQQESFPALVDLANAVPFEIDYYQALWSGDFDVASYAAEKILSELKHSDLQGYRALWYYQYAAALQMSGMEEKARIFYAKAKSAAPNIRWLVDLAKNQKIEESGSSKSDPVLLEQIEQLESQLAHLGTTFDRRYTAFEKSILDGLTSRGSAFEEAQRKLGQLLGFNSKKEESEGSPDPYWIVGDICIVFEDYVDAKDTTPIDVKKARQVASHPTWIRSKNVVSDTATIYPVLVAAIDTMHHGAEIHLREVGFWAYVDFLKWATNALGTIRNLRTQFHEPGDLVWHANAAQAFIENKIDAKSLLTQLKQNIASKILKVI